MQNARFAAIVIAALTLAGDACKGREQPAAPSPPRARVLRDVPIAQPSRLVDTSGTIEVERRVYVADSPLDSVAGFYRASLVRLGWQLESDRADPPAGRIDLYARKAEQTLWVHIERRAAQLTQFTLIGNATPDTTRQRPGAKAGGP